MEPDRIHWWQRIIRRLAFTAWGSWLIGSRLHSWDSAVLRLTKGRTTATTLLTGYEVIQLRSRGARTGKPRITPLLAIDDDGGLLLVATNFGSSRHPAWYFNLKAQPQVEVERRLQTFLYEARELAGEDWTQAWQRAVNHFRGYAAYRARTKSRDIPIFRLLPNSPNRSGAKI
jgi:deazaflavin-dependent oxidoreductase (nitroreductase family)